MISDDGELSPRGAAGTSTVIDTNNLRIKRAAVNTKDVHGGWSSVSSESDTISTAKLGWFQAPNSERIVANFKDKRLMEITNETMGCVADMLITLDGNLLKDDGGKELKWTGRNTVLVYGHSLSVKFQGSCPEFDRQMQGLLEYEIYSKE